MMGTASAKTVALGGLVGMDKGTWVSSVAHCLASAAKQAHGQAELFAGVGKGTLLAVGATARGLNVGAHAGLLDGFLAAVSQARKLGLFLLGVGELALASLLLAALLAHSSELAHLRLCLALQDFVCLNAGVSGSGHCFDCRLRLVCVIRGGFAGDFSRSFAENKSFLLHEIPSLIRNPYLPVENSIGSIIL